MIQGIVWTGYYEARWGIISSLGYNVLMRTQLYHMG